MRHGDTDHGDTGHGRHRRHGRRAGASALALAASWPDAPRQRVVTHTTAAPAASSPSAAFYRPPSPCRPPRRAR